MLTLDLIKDAGGEAANFCEMGGLTSPEVMYKAMEAVLADPQVKSLLVVLIGGFNRMDEMAEGGQLSTSPDRAQYCPHVRNGRGAKIMARRYLPTMIC